MAVTINIQKSITDYIDPETGIKMSYEEFNKKYSKVPTSNNIVGFSGGNKTTQIGEGKNKEN